MTLGLYKHYKGAWYIGLFSWLWESTNGQPRVRKVLYLSLGNLFSRNWRQTFNIREYGQFMHDDLHPTVIGPTFVIQPYQGQRLYRFRRVFPWWQPK